MNVVVVVVFEFAVVVVVVVLLPDSLRASSTPKASSERSRRWIISSTYVREIKLETFIDCCENANLTVISVKMVHLRKILPILFKSNQQKSSFQVNGKMDWNIVFYLTVSIDFLDTVINAKGLSFPRLWPNQMNQILNLSILQTSPALTSIGEDWNTAIYLIVSICFMKYCEKCKVTVISEIRALYVSDFEPVHPSD